MTKLETIALDEFEVTFTMRAGEQFREWTVQIPAVDEEHAKRATHDIAWGINEASKHVWKMTGDEPKAVRVSAERSDPSKASDLDEVS